jgi:copper transport protein
LIRYASEQAPMGLRRLVFLILWLGFSSIAAHGHATLLHTEPQANGRLSDAPVTVTLIFNERVEPIFNSIRVVDNKGRRVDRGEPRPAEGGEGVEVDLLPLGDGPYGVLWRINSADGHQMQGRFGFGVRADPPDEDSLPEVAGIARGPLWKIYMPAAKWLSMTALVVWLGGVWFLLGQFLPLSARTAIHPSSSELGGRAIRPVLAVTWVAALFYFIAEGVALAGQTATLADVPLSDALSPAVLSIVLGKTHYGFWWMIRIAAALAMLVLCAARLRQVPIVRPSEGVTARGVVWNVLLASLAGLVLLTIPLTGHAGSVSDHTWLAVASDWLHLAATALWLGSLVHFAVIVWLLDQPGQNFKPFLGLLTSRFSNIAKICVPILLASGAYNTWLHLPRWGSFIDTDYGRVLTVKLLLVLPILWIAAANLRRVLPALRDTLPAEAAQTWVRRFRRLLPAEATLGMMVLAVVAILTSLPPASTVVAAGPAVLTQRAGVMTVSLRVEPNKVGDNRAVITLTDTDGRTRSDARRVTLYVRSLDMDMGLETVQAEPSPEGGYEARIMLSMAGRWLFSVEISPPQGDTFLTEFRIPTSL